MGSQTNHIDLPQQKKKNSGSIFVLLSLFDLVSHEGSYLRTERE